MVHRCPVGGIFVTEILSGARLLVPQGFGNKQRRAMYWFNFAAILAIGWGVGVVAWLLTGHQATYYFVSNVPRAQRLWRCNVLTSRIPILKYLTGGLLLLALGAVLMKQLWGLWIRPFDIGLIVGGATGLLNSLIGPQDRSKQVDFLLANRRYVDDSKVAISTEDELS